jgi:hypothetical protein
MRPEPAVQYAAIIIDKGHEFEPERLKLMAPMGELATDLLLHDDAQSI